MSSKQGGGTLQSQIARLEGRMSKNEIEIADDLALNQPNVVRLAFKKIDKSPKQKGLSKKAMEFYEQVRKINEKTADQWLADRLAEKG